MKVQVWNPILNISITFFLLSEGTWPWPALTTSIPAIVAALAPWFSPFGSFPLRSVWLPFSDGRMQDTRTGSMSSNSVLSAKMWDTRFLPLWWPFMPLWSSFCSFIGGFLWRLEHVCGKEWRQKQTLIYIRSENFLENFKIVNLKFGCKSNDFWEFLNVRSWIVWIFASKIVILFDYRIKKNGWIWQFLA